MGVQINGDTGNISATKADYSGNVTIGGTLTYEDVTNIDSVGLITARNGIEVGARPGVAASISVDGNMIVSGITTFGGAISGTTATFSGAITGDGSGLTGIAATDNVRTGILDVAGVSTFRDNIFQTGGRIVRGSTSTIQDGDAIAGGVNITGTDMDASVIMSVFGNDGDFNRISGAKSRNATIGSHTVVNDGDVLLSMKAFGSDGTDFEEAARIEMVVNGSPGDNDMPGKIVFATASDGAASPTPRMEINSAGIVTCREIPSFKIQIASQNSPNAGTISEDNGFTLSATARDAFNTGSYFSEATGRFTAPVEGLYFFGVSIMRSSGEGTGSPDIRIKKNASLMLARSYRSSYRTSFESHNVQTITNMQKDHYITFDLGGNMSVYEDDSYMFGYLIG